MAEIFVVDTHALIWYLTANSRLGVGAKKVLDEAASVLALPAIAFAEACWIVDAGKTPIPSTAHLIASIDSDARMSVVPLGRTILDRSLELQSISEMHDRLIVATALMLQDQRQPVALLTRDNDITASGLVRTIW